MAIAVPIVGTLMLPMTLLVAAGRTTDYSLNRLARPALVATGCAASVAIGDVLIDASGTSPPLGSLASWTIVTCAVIWTATFQHAREARRALTQRVLEAEHPDHAAELASRCRAELGDESLEPDARVLLTLNLAGALISLSSRADQEDALPEALALLEGAARTSPPALAFTAAGQLVAAMEVKAERSGDEVGYEGALELLTETAERASATVPDAPGRALAARAEWYAQRAGREPRPEEAARLHSLALAEQRRAVAATPPGAESHAPREAALARLAAAYPLHDDLDSAISDCRASLRPLRSSGDPERAATMLALADLLELRAILEPEGGIGKMLDKLWPGRPRTGVVDYLWPDRATHDVMRAMVLCIRAGFGGGSSAEAAERLPRLRDLLIKTSRTWLPSASERQTGWMYSLVVREHARRSGSAAAAVAARWAGWASERGDDQQAAKAWWCWVTSISADLQRRVLRDKEHRISNIQGVIVQAADALVRAGRLRDGAVALELGRAILLTERMERDRDDIPLRLLASGHPELADRWRESSRLVQRADREAFERTGATSPDEPALASAEYLALTGFDRLVREIGRLPGYEDVHALPDYEDLREAVSEGPLVYLAAAAGGGFALIVTAAAEPVLVELPRLDRDSVAAQARTLLAATRGQELLRAMDALLPRLRADVVAPLAAHLPQDSLVTLVPVGALSELPIHVAGLEPGADGVWHDATGGIVFRYAPNARVLARAQRTAEALSGAEPRLLTAAVPSASGLPRLDRAIAESDGVARGFPGPAEVCWFRDLLGGMVRERSAAFAVAGSPATEYTTPRRRSTARSSSRTGRSRCVRCSRRAARRGGWRCCPRASRGPWTLRSSTRWWGSRRRCSNPAWPASSRVMPPSRTRPPPCSCSASSRVCGEPGRPRGHLRRRRRGCAAPPRRRSRLSSRPCTCLRATSFPT